MDIVPGPEIASQAILAARRPHRRASPREPCRIQPLHAVRVGDNDQAPAHRRCRPGTAGQVPHPHAAAGLPDQPPRNFTVHPVSPLSCGRRRSTITRARARVAAEPLTVYFCTNLVGTLKEIVGARVRGERVEVEYFGPGAAE